MGSEFSVGGSGFEFRVNGVPIKVPSKQEMAAEAAKGELHPYVLMRVADMDPSHGSEALRARRRKVPCQGCGEICWYDPDSVASLLAFKLQWLCAQCVGDQLRLKKALGGG